MTGTEAAWVPWAISGASALYSGLSGKGGSGGKKGGSSGADTSFLKPFQHIAAPLSNMMNRTLTGGAGFEAGVKRGTRFFSDIESNPDVLASMGALRQVTDDPTKFTDPLFLQERERLGAELAERSRQGIGLRSTGAESMVSRGLSDFTNRYLDAAINRRTAGAQALFGQTQGLGESLFTPFRFFSSALPGFGGAPVVPPSQYNNQKAQFASMLGNLGGSYLGGAAERGFLGAAPGPK